MKYLAILKDSLREALDTKVLYVMVGLSLLFIILTASIGFSPVPPEEAFPNMMNSPGMRMYWPDRGQALSAQGGRFLDARFIAENVKPMSDARSYANRDYAFTLEVHENYAGSFAQDVDFWSKPAPENWRGFDRSRRMGQPVNNDGKPPVEPAVSKELMAEFVKHQIGAGTGLTVRKVEFKEKRTTGGGAKGGDNNVNNLQGNIYVFTVETQGSQGVRGWPTDLSFLFGLISSAEGSMRGPPGELIYFVQSIVFNTIGAFVALIMGVIITAFFIPNMLRKGTVDMLLVKPIHRPVLLITKYVGGLTFMFLNSVVAIGGVWLVIGLRSGIWTNGFLCTILTLTFFFAILYAISTLFGVLTRSTIASILITILCWFIFFIVGQIYTLFSMVRKTNRPWQSEDIPEAVYWVIDAMHFVLPRTSDLNAINSRLIAEIGTENFKKTMGLDALPDIDFGESITVSLVFIAVMLALACWRFSRKDF